MKRMLFNATQQEELRVAIVDGQRLIDIDIETTGREQRKSNIYKGVITRIEPSLEACFVNYGEERHGFLPFKEVARTYFKEGVDVRNTSIKDALREGQEIMVQVEKEERGNKGAALTSFVSLAGRYLVLMPNNPRGGGVSRRVEGEDRQELRETMDQLDLPNGMSVIARTAGIGRSVQELQWDLNYLMQLWRAIEGAGQSAAGAFLIYQESSLVIRAIRDYFQPDIGEILIDTDDIYEQAHQFMSHVMPDMVHRVKRYRDDVPLFSRFQIEHQIETAYSRTVPLPSGGAIVIDHTEALVSIDVNSARSTRGGDIESTAFNTNCEAADEVARQLRLRDLGGLIVIDFIDMENSKNQREVETRLKDALHYDRARVQMGKISRFGLMELSRQRLRPSLSEGSHVTCPRCNGTGHIRDTESSALQVLRIIQEEAMKENSAAIHVQVPVDVAAFLLNEKRGEILKIETRHRVTVILIPNKHLETPHYKLERIKHDDPRLDDQQASYAMAEQADTDIGYNKRQKEEAKPRQEAMVKGITPDQPAPIVERKPELIAPSVAFTSPEEGFFSKIFKFFRATPAAPVAPAIPAAESKPPRDRNGRGRRNRNSRDRDGRNRNEERNATADTAKQAQPAAAETQGQQQRQPRPPKEGRDTNQGNQNRKERPPRNREDRHANASANAAEAKVEEVALNTTAIAAPVAALTTPSANAEVTAAPNTAAGEQGEEQHRRRRRRGGRNRNRRDRENVVEGAEALDAAESMDGNEVEVAQEVVALTTTTFKADLFSSEKQDEYHAPVEAKPVSTDSMNGTQVSDISPSETTLAAPVAPQESPRNIEPAPVAEIAVVAAVVAAAASAPAAAEPVATGIFAPSASVNVEAKPAAAIQAKPAPAPMPLDDLRAVLGSAGLTLATTDPDKLQAAQEAAAQIVVAPRIPRERKPLPPVSTEPLTQVETQRQ
jgi:ribonuclease E